jgi:hypothetical protein
MEYTWFHLPNYGYITSKLPEDLFQKLQIECELARKTRFEETDILKEEMISGLTGNGIAKHYYVSDCQKELNKFTMKMADEYENQFNYLSNFKTININMGFINTHPWINIQKKGEYIPNHNHDGLLAYVIWIKIPFDVDEERKNLETTSCFSFSYNNIVGGIFNKLIPVSKEMEGTIMMFPSSLNHQVYPFYTSDDVRISISGMISFDGNNPMPNKNQKNMYNL